MGVDGRLLTTAEVARRLGWRVRKVQRMAERGELPVARKLGGDRGAYLFDVSAIDFYIRQQARESA